MIWHYLSKRHDNWQFHGIYFDFGILNIKRFIILTLLTGRLDPAAARSIHMTTQHDPVRFNAVRLWLPTLMSTSCDNSSAFLKIRSIELKYSAFWHTHTFKRVGLVYSLCFAWQSHRDHFVCPCNMLFHILSCNPVYIRRFSHSACLIVVFLYSWYSMYRASCGIKFIYKSVGFYLQKK